MKAYAYEDIGSGGFYNWKADDIQENWSFECLTGEIQDHLFDMTITERHDYELLEKGK